MPFFHVKLMGRVVPMVTTPWRALPSARAATRARVTDVARGSNGLWDGIMKPPKLYLLEAGRKRNYQQVN